MSNINQLQAVLSILQSLRAHNDHIINEQLSVQSSTSSTSSLFSTILKNALKYGLQYYYNYIDQQALYEQGASVDNNENIIVITEIEPGSVLSTSTCSICFEPYNQNKKIAITKCSHSYCYTCITEWLKTQRTCPLCRTDL
jgi:hypothetical protein